jgi:hypothetical protein
VTQLTRHGQSSGLTACFPPLGESRLDVLACTQERSVASAKPSLELVELRRNDKPGNGQKARESGQNERGLEGKMGDFVQELRIRGDCRVAGRLAMTESGGIVAGLAGGGYNGGFFA